jgi:hypothetical protein
MKTFLTAALATLSLAAAIAPAAAFELTSPASVIAGSGFDWAADTSIVERRRPRVPGGSGCDSPRDVAEHPECR